VHVTRLLVDSAVYDRVIKMM